MENAADALKMAAAILIFIIAISSSFSLFGTAKQTADSIITMRDKQAYLEAEELEGVMYTSSQEISTYEGFTEYGDRIVGIDTVISTIYRYSKEKYAVTIMDSDGNVKARYDSSTENVMRQWYNIADTEDETAEEQKNNYTDEIITNISTVYVPKEKITLNLESIYSLRTEGNSKIRCGAPWYGNEEQIRLRISKDIEGDDYTYNKQTYTNKILQQDGGLQGLLEGKKIVEVTNEIDQSKYLEDNGEKTNLLQEYQMPTVEIVYIILDD